MNKLVILIMLIGLMFSCSQDKNRWQTEDIQPLATELIDVSSAYYDTSIDNFKLKNKFPDFFNSIPDSLLTQRRKDEVANDFNKKVIANIQLSQVQDSLSYLFGAVKSYDETFVAPTVYSFTGEMPYLNPVAYFAQTHDLVFGLDWFLGEDEESYISMGIPNYLRRGMSFEQFVPKVAENIARQMAPYPIQKRSFLEMMVYEGKITALMKKFCPNYSTDQLMNFNKEEIEWLKTNEADVYLYFTENDLFFSDDNKLNERFISPAPFSKFYLEDDAETPGRVGVWMGWQIVEKFLNENPEVTVKEMIKKSGEEIFKASGYKPN